MDDEEIALQLKNAQLVLRSLIENEVASLRTRTMWASYMAGIMSDVLREYEKRRELSGGAK